MNTYLITWANYGTRINPDKINKKDITESCILDFKHRKIVHNLIKTKIETEKYKVLAFNVLKDHVHIVLVCDYSSLSNIIKNIKGNSSFEFNKKTKKSLKGQGSQNKLWAKRFHFRELKDNKQIEKAVNYVENNHFKHDIESVLR